MNQPDNKPQKFNISAELLPVELQKNDFDAYFNWVREKRINTPDKLIPKEWYNELQIMPPIVAGFFDSMFYTVTSKQEVEELSRQILSYIFEANECRKLMTELYDILMNREDFCNQMIAEHGDSGVVEKIYSLQETKTDYEFGYVLYAVFLYIEEFDE